MGRQPSCYCGECPRCVVAARAYEAYQSLTPKERRAIVARRDPEKVRAADKARYQRDKAKRRAAMDAYAKANPEKVNANKRAWIERNPEKRTAHNKVAYALRVGKLVRQPCEKCGSTHRVHAHHDDYSKPLEVRWLCPKHHAEERLRR